MFSFSHTLKRTGTIALITELGARVLHFSSSCICNFESFSHESKYFSDEFFLVSVK